jgi:hypothetical protein
MQLVQTFSALIRRRIGQAVFGIKTVLVGPSRLRLCFAAEHHHLSPRGL